MAPVATKREWLRVLKGVAVGMTSALAIVGAAASAQCLHGAIPPCEMSFVRHACQFAISLVICLCRGGRVVMDLRLARWLPLMTGLGMFSSTCLYRGACYLPMAALFTTSVSSMYVALLLLLWFVYRQDISRHIPLAFLLILGSVLIVQPFNQTPPGGQDAVMYDIVHNPDFNKTAFIIERFQANTILTYYGLVSAGSVAAMLACFLYRSTNLGSLPLVDLTAWTGSLGMVASLVLSAYFEQPVPLINAPMRLLVAAHAVGGGLGMVLFAYSQELLASLETCAAIEITKCLAAFFLQYCLPGYMLFGPQNLEELAGVSLVSLTVLLQLFFIFKALRQGPTLDSTIQTDLKPIY